jgi:hypothetical protein
MFGFRCPFFALRASQGKQVSTLNKAPVLQMGPGAGGLLNADFGIYRLRILDFEFEKIFLPPACAPLAGCARAAVFDPELRPKGDRREIEFFLDRRFLSDLQIVHTKFRYSVCRYLQFSQSDGF